jgi:hypothetical protein
MQGGTDGSRGLAEDRLVPEDREDHHAGHHPHGEADQGGERRADKVAAQAQREGPVQQRQARGGEQRILDQPRRRQRESNQRGGFGPARQAAGTLAGTLPFWQAGAATVGAFAGALAVALIAMRQIGGITGDVHGGAQQAGEIAALLAITAAVAGGHPAATR